MTPVLCNAPHRGQPCSQVLFKAGKDFTGWVEIKCPRCRAIVTLRFQDGHVA